MSTAQINPSQHWIWFFGIVYSVVILGIGLWVSLVTGEWIAILCAVGLVLVPIGGLAVRSRRSH
ncbi:MULTISPECIES: hypothetical protein [unclassified Cryobacterium]|uniref:hypothetical protein n=1 Tax=unclassified Cryobacterium TaxID=2649013 RepID=UPI00106BE3D6|nr:MULTISPECIES: hypothetical protein [unclassified Cryobacterium]TFD09314.1 hypothetical protein E3T29_03950 [Cryobacterium sp. TMT1-66-1]TFD14876.1 hypothetical protein E3T35_00290 [Cryobacterium sp. TMT1-2-2]